MDPAVGTLIGAGAEAGLNVGGSLWSSQKDVDLYREARDYNQPINQVKRLKEAGLNPALMYGSGSIANTVGPAPHTNAPRVDVRNLMLENQQIQNLDLQQEQIKANIENMKLMAQGMKIDQSEKEREIQELRKVSSTVGFPVFRSDPWQARLGSRAAEVLGSSILMPSYTNTKSGNRPGIKIGKGEFKNVKVEYGQ